MTINKIRFNYKNKLLPTPTWKGHIMKVTLFWSSKEKKPASHGRELHHININFAFVPSN